MRSDREFSSASDDADALVADLLQQFSSTDHKAPQQPLATSSHSRSEPAAEPTTAIPSPKVASEEKAYAVEVPAISDADEYEFLPGHFVVREILEKKQTAEGPRYKVELESSDKEWMPPSHIETLTNGPEALSHFKSRGKRKPEEMLTDGRHRKVQRPEGFVSSETLIFSDDDDDEPVVSATATRSTRRDRPPLRLTMKRQQPSDEEGYYSSSSSTNESDVRPTRRSTRAATQRYTFESSEEASSDDLLGSSTVTISNGRRSGRNIVLLRSARHLRARKSDSESDTYAPRGVRFSTRTRKSLKKNLRERLESDISENEAVPTEKRYIGAKEVFFKVSTDDPFRQRHRNVCDTCSVLGDDKEKGPLVFCQGCTSAFHSVCLGPRGSREHIVTKVGHDKFVLQCRRCIGIAHKKDSTAPHLGHCTECKAESPLAKPFKERLNSRQEQKQREKNGGVDPITTVDKSLVDNVDNVLFRCINCTRAYHFEHLPPRSEDSHASQTEGLSSTDIANMRFKEYGRRWMCYDCVTAPGEIEAIIAWRPVDVDSYTPGFTADVLDEAEKEYLIKWKRKSYYRTTWMPGTWVWGVAAPVMRKAFLKSPKALKPQMTAEDAIPEDYLRVDIVFDVRYTNIVSNRTKEIDMARVKEVKEAYVKFKGLLYEDAVWEAVPNPEDTERWNDFKAAYEDWVLRDYVRIPKSGALKKHLAHVRAQDFKSTLVKKSQPSCLTGGKLMEYQLDGLNWLYYMWYKQQNAILADEMGLGKTIQVIAFLATLIQDHRCWPFLVVVPNSTCPNWRREVKKWAPSLRVVSYYGSSAARKIAHDYEMFPNGATDLRCHIVVTSYETMIDEKARRVLSGIPWAGLVVDEGQRLKNEKNLLYESLSRISFPFKVLLTGTPLQNNTLELFNLLQFCDPKINAQELEEKYETLTKENVPELHDLIRPFFLRRTKAQVLTFLPPMAQIIVPVSMSIVQKKLYKSILAKNSKLIKSIFQNNQDQNLKQTERHSLSNILMQLRKCLCHPFVYSKAIEERTFNAAVSHRNLVEASGKLKLLELMLPKLKERGHRVLLFSQFLDNLDIVEDFLDGLGLLHRRLDGSMSSHEKQKRIDDFNAPNSPYFAFLLSTRSGGVGINLATADTVIIMDPDFNPHQDIQALSRAHRIGQQKKVLVFQLMTRASAEEKIMQIGKKKMALDHVLIEKMDADDESALDLESILRHGAEALFENDDTGDIHYDSDSVDRLLDRSQAENTQVGNDASAESQFSFARVWANDTAALEDRLGDSDAPTPPSNTLWEKILQERERAAAEEAAAQAQALGRGKRKRNVVDYAINEVAGEPSPTGPAKKSGRRAESDAEFTAEDEGSDDVDSDDVEPESGELTPLNKKPVQKGRPLKRVDPDKVEIPSLDGNSDRPPAGPSRPFPCLACNQPHPVGYCPLKLAGVEHCGLCGIAHFGYQRTCPHLNSEAQITVMLQSLKQSTEPRYLVDQAKQYLRNIKGDLVWRRRRAEKLNSTNNGSTNNVSTNNGSTNNGNTAESFPPGGASRPGQTVLDLTQTSGPQQVPSSVPPPQAPSQAPRPNAAPNYQGFTQGPSGAKQYPHSMPSSGPPPGAFQPQFGSQMPQPPPNANYHGSMPGGPGNTHHAHPPANPIPPPAWRNPSDRPQ